MLPLEVPRCTQDETRRGEDKSHSLTQQFGRFSISNLYLEGPKPSLYRRRTGHEVQEAYTRSYPKVPCTSPTSSTYSEV